eukprot:3118975-Pleurochrysis_carterae.AAC.3
MLAEARKHAIGSCGRTHSASSKPSTGAKSSELQSVAERECGGVTGTSLFEPVEAVFLGSSWWALREREGDRGGGRARESAREGRKKKEHEQECEREQETARKRECESEKGGERERARDRVLELRVKSWSST